MAQNKGWFSRNLYYIIGGLSLGLIGFVAYRFFKGKGILTNALSKSKLVLAHCGAWDGQGGKKCCNLLSNIEQNIKAGTDILEMDIQVTKDGVPVLFHDDTLDAQTNSSGKIQNKTWNEVKTITYKGCNETIPSFEQVVYLLKKYNGKSMLQLDKCSDSEWSVILKSGVLKGLEDRTIAKGTQFKPFNSLSGSKVMWMPILPSKYVGAMNNESTLNEIVENLKGSQFCELQFGLKDSLLLNGTLARKCKDIGVKLVGIAVTGSKDTNPNYVKGSGWGDNAKSWAKYFNEIGCGAVMTNYPNAIKSIIN